MTETLILKLNTHPKSAQKGVLIPGQSLYFACSNTRKVHPLCHILASNIVFWKEVLSPKKIIFKIRFVYVKNK